MISHEAFDAIVRELDSKKLKEGEQIRWLIARAAGLLTEKGQLKKRNDEQGGASRSVVIVAPAMEREVFDG